MKKIVLSLALVATVAFVSCKDTAKETPAEEAVIETPAVEETPVVEEAVVTEEAAVEGTEVPAADATATEAPAADAAPVK